MSRLLTLGFLLAVGALSGGAGSAAAPLSNSLSTALSTASSPGPVVALGTGKVQPTGDGAAPPAGESPDSVAAAYGYTTHVFGNVTAVGPSTISIPGDPSTVDPVQSISDGERLALFVSLLDQDQWDLLRGPNGIGFGDLSTDEQALLFRSFFRPGTMKASVNFLPNEAVPIDQQLRGVAEAVKDPVLTDDDVNGARLRLGLRPEILLPLTRGTVPPPGSIRSSGVDYVDARVADDPSGTNYLLAHTAPNASAPSTVRPNVPDSGDLDLSGAWANTAVSPRPGESLDDLLATIHTAGGPEIYANPQLDHRDLTIAGGRTPSTAGDLLRAIAFAAAGTYRKVGDVYALTFDKSGSAVDWVNAADAASAARRRSIGQEESDGSVRSETDLTGAYSPLGLSADEMGVLQGDTIDLAYASLTPAQQDYVQRSAAKLNALLGPSALDARASIHIILRPYLQATVPSLDGPAELETEARLADLFGSRVSTTTTGSVEDALKAFKRRAVIVRATSKGQIDDVIAAMAGAGMNELWVDVDKTGASPDGPDAHPATKQAYDTVAYATAAGKEHAITVRIYVDISAWPGAPTEARDMTVMGVDRSGGGDVYASPLAPAAKAHALAVVDGLAVPSGVGGIVFGSTTPPGYGSSSSVAPAPSVFERQFGYNLAAREEFLRLTHADPLDILPPTSGSFDSVIRNGRDAGVDDSMYVAWVKYRGAAAAALVKAVETESSRKLPNLPVLVEVRDASTDGELFANPSTPSAAVFAAPSTPSAALVEVPVDAAGDSSRLCQFLDAQSPGAHGGVVIDLRHADDPASAINGYAAGR